MASFTILEPISTGDVIDRAVRLYRRNFTPLVAITAVPTLIGYVVSVMFWSGYTSLLTSTTTSRGMPASAIWMLAFGGLGYPVWAYVLLLTVSGLSRVVGDHLMLSEPITFRRCLAAVRRRLGAITLMGLLSIAMLFAAYLIVFIVLIVLLLVVGLIAGLMASASLPQWVSTVALVITIIVAVALTLLLICAVVARVVFLPQIVMIEGQSAGNALGRAIRLGKGNWYRVGAIALFTYFVSTSLLAAFTMPVLTALYFSGALTTEFFVGPTWSILYTSFGQISNLLSLPIWVVSFTLLYFDSRVRKEAYDLDLIAREINPGFIWQPTVQPSAFGYQMPRQFGSEREYVQTSPLGLAGYRPPASSAREEPPAGSVQEQPPTSVPRTESEELRDKFQRAAQNLSAGEDSEIGRPEEAKDATCSECGATLLPGASFCMNCGRVTR
jgi:zinc ribbon protein